ncbi:MAG: hypothetical protein DRQ40_02120 [Gammaproteobacteria bacterium]|nr:MAG: hypothetical protein DRQ40_02120 [Gammaproteobacteria bacterium]
MTINDAMYAVINITNLSLEDEYYNWLGANGGIGDTVMDREYTMLVSQGGVPGTVDDMWYQVLITLGYGPGSLGDLLFDFWVSGGNLSPVDLILSIGNLGITFDAAGGSLANGRATPATVTGFEGNILPASANEIRYRGARRVTNLAASSEDLTVAPWVKVDATLTPGILDPDGGTSAYTVIATANAGRVYINDAGYDAGAEIAASFWVRRRTGSGTVLLYGGDGANGVDVTASLTGAWQRLTPAVTAASGAADRMGVKLNVAGDAVDVWHPQAEDVTNQTNQTPATYINSEQIFNCNVLGVKAYDTHNGNSISGTQIVIEAPGADISPKPHMLHEPAATNFAFPSDVPATQTITLAAANYTVWLDDADGLGSIVLSGGATGTATSAAALQFVADGTPITFTHAGGGNIRWQVEDNDFRTSYMPTVASAEPRDIDAITLPLVVGSNFKQDAGILVFEHVLEPGQAEVSSLQGLLSLQNSTDSLLRLNATATQAESTDGVTSAVVTTPAFGPGTEIIYSVIWDSTSSVYVVGVSVDQGVSFTWGPDQVYGGSFVVESIFRIFLNANFTNLLDLAVITGGLVDGSVEASKDWVESRSWALSWL